MVTLSKKEYITFINIVSIAICIIFFRDLTSPVMSIDAVYFISKFAFIILPYAFILFFKNPFIDTYKGPLVMAHYFNYCAYYMLFHDSAYYHAFSHTFLLGALLMKMSRPQSIFIWSYGLIIYLAALFLCEEVYYIRDDMTAKPDMFADVVVIAISSFLFQWLLNERRVSEMKKNEAFADIGKKTSFFMHELKNPIHRIGQNLNDDQNVANVDNLRRDTDKVIDIIYALDKINPNNPSTMKELNITHFPLHSLFQDILLSYEDLIEGLNIEVEMDFQNIKVYSDYPLLYLACKNLVKNAIEALAAEEERKLSFFAEKDQLITHIEVINKASDLDQESARKIFNPHFTTKNNVSNKGLGLYIVEKIMGVLDSSIESEFDDEQNLVMHIELKDVVL